MTRMERRRRRRRILRIKLATTAAVLALTTASIVGTPSGRCRMTSTVWLEIAEWWMPSTPSTMFGGALAP